MNREMGFLREARVSDTAIQRMIRGELAIGVSSRRKLVFGRLVEVLTMMQSCASAAKLRAAGPFFSSALEPVRITASRHSDRRCLSGSGNGAGAVIACLAAGDLPTQ
jgi:hypothetical protein